MQQHMQDKDARLAQKFNQLEDRLILISLPVLIVVLISWAVISAFPILSTIGYLIISVVVLLVFCVVFIRMTQVAKDWATILSDENTDAADPAMFLIFGLIGIGILVLVGIGALIDMIVHAGVANGSRDVLSPSLLIILGIQYRAIIVRYLRKTEPTQD